MLELRSPSKINLFLRILRRREDGYHELASLFQTINLCDQLQFSLTPHDHFTCTDQTLPTDQSNLVLKALALFRRKTGISTPVTIHLDKQIPHQAGLGGGSGNAATTLWAMNQLCKSQISDQTLAEWAGEIGSDISLFLTNGTAYGTGRGEQLRSLPPLPPKKLTIVKPMIGLSTPQVFSKVDATKFLQRNPEQSLDQFLKGNPIYYNDLEEPAFLLLPELEKLKEALIQSGFTTVLMSGSGTSFFCLGEGKIPQSDHISYYQAHFINRSPGCWYN